MVTLCDEVLPVFTFPKLRVIGLTERVFVAAMPEPVRAIVVGDVGALLVIERFPDTAPVVVGWKATVIVVC